MKQLLCFFLLFSTLGSTYAAFFEEKTRFYAQPFEVVNELPEGTLKTVQDLQGHTRYSVFARKIHGKQKGRPQVQYVTLVQNYADLKIIPEYLPRIMINEGWALKERSGKYGLALVAFLCLSSYQGFHEFMAQTPSELRETFSTSEGVIPPFLKKKMLRTTLGAVGILGLDGLLRRKTPKFYNRSYLPGAHINHEEAQSAAIDVQTRMNERVGEPEAMVIVPPHLFDVVQKLLVERYAHEYKFGGI